jgi:crotonobetainyl-CoA:carnitine CoA-transferase CaiB-like acyl-CoA transferase
MEELLSPYRVLDITDAKGMLCGKILADMGADVIKLEPPGGDPCRKYGPFYKDRPDPDNSLFWFDSNCNKRGITLNLTTEDGKGLFYELIKQTDILIESFTPGYMDGLGIGYDWLWQQNPRLIMTSITPFGQKGPKAQYKTTELTRWAGTGVMYTTGYPDRAPTWMTIPHSRIQSNMEAAMSSLAALHYRNKTGEGQYIDVSMQVSALDTLQATPEELLFRGIDYSRQGTAYQYLNVNQKWELACRDGYIFTLITGGGHLPSAENLGRIREWMKEDGMAPDWFIELDWVKDYDASIIDQKLVDRVERVFEEFFNTKTKAELYERSLKDNLIIGPIQDPREAWEDKQLRERGFWTELRHADLNDDIPYSGSPAILSETPLRKKRPAPGIGEHNKQVYVEECGIPMEKFTMLKESGVI